MAFGINSHTGYFSTYEQKDCFSIALLNALKTKRELSLEEAIRIYFYYEERDNIHKFGLWPLTAMIEEATKGEFKGKVLWNGDKPETPQGFENNIAYGFLYSGGIYITRLPQLVLNGQTTTIIGNLHAMAYTSYNKKRKLINLVDDHGIETGYPEGHQPPLYWGIELKTR